MKPKTFKPGKSYYCGKEIFTVTAKYLSASDRKAYIVLADCLVAELYTGADWNEEAQFLRGCEYVVIKAVDAVEEKQNKQ